MPEIREEGKPFTRAQWKKAIDGWLAKESPAGAVLIVPPDMTRCYSMAGEITAYLYERLSPEHRVDILPAVGTHRQMTREEKKRFFGEIPEERFLTHDWRQDNVPVCVIPRAVVSDATDGKFSEAAEVSADRRLFSGEYGAILSVGQVVPHEVIGMANYTKNILVGLGGRKLINLSHMVSAVCNIETIMGNRDTPARLLFDYVQKNYLDRLPLTYFLTVTAERNGGADLLGLFIGRNRETFEEAAALAAKKNITWLPERVKKVVAWLDPEEFKSAWVGNKAIYRTRMAIADGGELLILAPGLRAFGENEETDASIRRYGYCGSEKIMALYRAGAFEGLEMAAAHLIHGSSEGRFVITYATDPSCLSEEEVRSVGFSWMDVREAMERYQPKEKETGYYEIGGEGFYFVKAPAVGLWRTGKMEK